jgi:hypothetical protein
VEGEGRGAGRTSQSRQISTQLRGETSDNKSTRRTLPRHYARNLNDGVDAGLREDTLPASTFKIEREDAKGSDVRPVSNGFVRDESGMTASGRRVSLMRDQKEKSQGDEGRRERKGGRKADVLALDFILAIRDLARLVRPGSRLQFEPVHSDDLKRGRKEGGETKGKVSSLIVGFEGKEGRDVRGDRS